MAFKTEQKLFDKALSSKFIRGLISANPGTTTYCEAEVPNLYGIPDYVIFKVNPHANLNKRFTTYAFEMKLSNWKRALVQAYCYQAFANKSYVLLDHSHIRSPRKNLIEFKKSNVGLLSIDIEGRVFLHFEPKYRKPYSKRAEVAWLRRVFHQEYIAFPPYFYKNEFHEVAIY